MTQQTTRRELLKVSAVAAGSLLAPQITTAAKTKKGAQKVNRFVLVHGAWLGAWCWDEVTPLLKKEGASVQAPDLPGHGSDQTPPKECSVDGYVDTVVKVIEAQDAPVVLVGHSMGGLVITQVAEKIPDRVSALVYVAAYLLKNGETLNQANQFTTDSLIGPNIELAPDYSTAGIKKEALRQVFCADASEADAAKLERLYRPEPGAAGAYPVHTTDANWGRIPRTYVHTARDRAVTPAMQKIFLDKTPCQHTMTIDSSHCPFFSKAGELSRILLNGAKKS